MTRDLPQSAPIPSSGARDAEWNESTHPRDEQGRWYHGTRTAFHDPNRTEPLYLTNKKSQAWKYAHGAHLGGAGTAKPHVKRFELKNSDKIHDISSHIEKAFENDEDAETGINEGIKEAKAKGLRYVTYEHPNAGEEGEHTVRISLYPHEDLAHAGTSHKEEK